ncbi:hypothetical protein [Novosphingobium sp. Fuku2-ISO-50]|nr:hypothetical protein [Novosphingobium sp. Fuku2-ISO-50]
MVILFGVGAAALVARQRRKQPAKA